MKFIRLDPPGTWCLNDAFLQQLAPLKTLKTFIEIGPGEGNLSYLLCSKGLKGTGIDFSPAAVNTLKAAMKRYMESGYYSIIETDFMEADLDVKADLVFSSMVMEHIKDELNFLFKMKKLCKKGGKILIGVPSRKNKWGIEDEVSGHFRRYERVELVHLFNQCGLKDIKIWSVGVPVANILLRLSNYLIKKNRANERKELSMEEKTKISGLKDIPFKTTFPPFFRLLLNKFTMYPFLGLQKLFYQTSLGIMMLGTCIVQE